MLFVTLIDFPERSPQCLYICLLDKITAYHVIIAQSKKVAQISPASGYKIVAQIWASGASSSPHPLADPWLAQNVICQITSHHTVEQPTCQCHQR